MLGQLMINVLAHMAVDDSAHRFQKAAELAVVSQFKFAGLKV